MASRTASTAVVAQPLSPEEFMTLLAGTGMISQGGNGDFRRMSLRQGMLVTDPGTDREEQWPPTDKGRGPAMRQRIVKPPVYMNTFFCSEDEQNGSFDARRIGRGDLNGKFLKKYDDPAEQAADQYANLDGYEAVAAHLGKRGRFVGDIQVQIVPESGQLTGEEPVFTLTLSTTSALDFRGTSANPNGGVVQEKNFIVQLGEFAMKQALEANPQATKQDIAKAVLDAMTALRLGGVVADVYIRQSSDPKTGNVWSVVSYVPVFIDTSVEPEQAALPEGVVGDDTASVDEIPF